MTRWRTLVEVLHIALGMGGAGVIASLEAWSLPHSAPVIWRVALVAMAAVALMGVRPLRLAWRADRDDRRVDG